MSAQAIYKCNRSAIETLNIFIYAKLKISIQCEHSPIFFIIKYFPEHVLLVLDHTLYTCALRRWPRIVLT